MMKKIAGLFLMGLLVLSPVMPLGDGDLGAAAQYREKMWQYALENDTAKLSATFTMYQSQLTYNQLDAGLRKAATHHYVRDNTLRKIEQLRQRLKHASW